MVFLFILPRLSIDTIARGESLIVPDNIYLFVDEKTGRPGRWAELFFLGGKSLFILFRGGNIFFIFKFFKYFFWDTVLVSIHFY